MEYTWRVGSSLMQTCAKKDKLQNCDSTVDSAVALPHNTLNIRQSGFTIATPDREHYQQTLAVAKLGYHILLEKPMAVSEEQCQEIVDVMGKDQILAICHVLR